MKFGIRYVVPLAILWMFMGACSQPDDPEQPGDGLAGVDLRIDGQVFSTVTGGTRAPGYTVNRILVLPFQKLNPALADNVADNFIPAWSFARQWNVGSFPVQSLSLRLPKSLAYKVLVIGYKQTDYDYNQRNSVSNLVELASQPQPSTFANFQLAPKSPAVVPEFYSCLCTAFVNGTTSIGTVFTPSDGTDITLNGQLKRFVSGLTVSVTNVPGFVKSMTLTAGKMVKAVRVNDTIASAVQVAGDNESRVIQKLVPVAGNVNFNVFLLPTLSVNKTTFSLVVEYGSTTESYLIKVPDSAVSQSNSIILKPNGIVNISGSYANINIGFEISGMINLDDNDWDGIN